MIKHIVVWKLKPSAEGADRAANARSMKQRLEALRGRVPGLRRLEVGINFNRTAAAYAVALVSEHDSREALDVYQNHPEHLACVDFIGKIRDQRIVVDYEV